MESFTISAYHNLPSLTYNSSTVTEVLGQKQKWLNADWSCPKDKEKVKRKNRVICAKPRKSPVNRMRSKSNSLTSFVNVHSAYDSNFQSPSSAPVSPTDGLNLPLSIQGQEGMELENVSEQAGGYENCLLTSITSSGVASSPSTLVSDSPFPPTSQSHLPSTIANRPRSQKYSLPVDPRLLSADNSGGIKRSNLKITATSVQPPSAVLKPLTSVNVPGFPTDDDALRALKLIVDYFQDQPLGLDPREAMTIGKLMERINQAKNQRNT